MSETGVISQEYYSTAELFRTINQSIIILKKKHFNLAGAASVTPEQLLQAGELLTQLLGQVIDALHSQQPQLASDDDQLQVPPFFIKRLQERHSSEMEWYLDDLRELLVAIRDEKPLTDDLITHLDELCGQLDAETSAIHRRLWRG
ncbi:MAG TPA: hypothetical protein VE863_01965 [Pyrinomonadaceae bacterium]|jgi:hypothetical protein|nr:hypothetical protein [Pyrinomonadaceae bacterium]